MEYDNDALDKKRSELCGLVRDKIPSSSPDPDQLVESLMNNYIQLTPPTEQDHTMSCIRLSSSFSEGGSSRKPGNICLNMKKLMEIVPDVTIATVGAATAPFWLLPLIALYVWNRLWCGSEERLSENEASVIYSLWKHRNKENKISVNDGFKHTNSTRRNANISSLKKDEYNNAINRLVQIGCIELSDSIIWMKECVNIKY